MKSWRTQWPKWGERQGRLHGWTWYEKWRLSEGFRRLPRRLDLRAPNWRRCHLSHCKGSLWSISQPISHTVCSLSHSKRVPFSLSLPLSLSLSLSILIFQLFLGVFVCEFQLFRKGDLVKERKRDWERLVLLWGVHRNYIRRAHREAKIAIQWKICRTIYIVLLGAML